MKLYSRGSAIGLNKHPTKHKSEVMELIESFNVKEPKTQFTNIVVINPKRKIDAPKTRSQSNQVKGENVYNQVIPETTK